VISKKFCPVVANIFVISQEIEKSIFLSLNTFLEKRLLSWQEINFLGATVLALFMERHGFHVYTLHLFTPV